MKFRFIAAAAAALALSTGAHAAGVFSDNFDSDATGYDVVPTGWYLSSTATNDVDVLGAGFSPLLPVPGNYVDLAGSNGKPGPGTLNHDLTVSGGQIYIATFQLAGNQRDAVTDTVTVMFGGSTLVVPVAPTAAFTTYSISAVAPGAGTSTMTLSFKDSRDGNFGALLDNVVVAVPEPSSIALMFAGLAALGFTARRRRG